MKQPGFGTQGSMKKQPGFGTQGPMTEEHGQQQADEYEVMMKVVSPCSRRFQGVYREEVRVLLSFLYQVDVDGPPAGGSPRRFTTVRRPSREAKLNVMRQLEPWSSIALVVMLIGCGIWDAVGVFPFMDRCV